MKIMKQMSQEKNYSFSDLLQIVKQLRGENGCPWDRVQTHQSVRKNMIEEAYEVCEAIDLQDTALLKEELGDVLLQVVFHSLMEEEIGSFTIDDVINDICCKLIRRHPHVFGEAKAATADQALYEWNKAKRETKGQKTCSETLNAVPAVLPALMRTQKVLGRAVKAESSKNLVDEISNVSECKLKGDIPTEESIGKLLLLVVELARRSDVDSEEALTKACNEFIKKVEEKESPLAK